MFKCEESPEGYILFNEFGFRSQPQLDCAALQALADKLNGLRVVDPIDRRSYIEPALWPLAQIAKIPYLLVPTTRNFV